MQLMQVCAISHDGGYHEDNRHHEDNRQSGCVTKSALCVEILAEPEQCFLAFFLHKTSRIVDTFLQSFSIGG